MRLAKVAGQAHELRGAVILHLVDHDVARMAHATTDERELEVQPFDGAQVFRAGQAHANRIQAQPVPLLDLVFDARVAPAQKALGVARELGLVHVADEDVLAEALDLLGIGKVADHVLVLLGLGQPLDALLETTQEVVDDQCALAGSRGKVLEFAPRAMRLGGRDDGFAFDAYVGEVALLEREIRESLVDGAQFAGTHVASHVAAAQPQPRHEGLERDR